MQRYILRYGNAASAPDADVKALRATQGVRVVDRSPNMLLVEADEGALRKQVDGLNGWSMHPEQQIPLPDTRQKIR